LSPTKQPRLHDMKRASYKWSNNSCWLDTSLELLFIAISRDFETSFSPRLSELTDADSLSLLSHAFEARTVIQGSDPSAPEDIVNVLFAQRESLRHDLVNKKIISAMDSFEAIFVCTNEISRVLTMSLTELLFHRHGWDPCSTIHVTVPSNSCMATSTFI
jgi:hypothetical protein